jgi:transposase
MAGVGIGKRIFMYQDRCDMRRSFDRLACMVCDELKEDPQGGDVFVFLNRSGSMMKILLWDEDGYVIWYKRLEEGRFQAPETKEVDHLTWMHMMEGVEAKIVKRHPRYHRNI